MIGFIFKMSQFCSVELRKKILSAILMLLMLTTNVVVSIDSIYCYCFKTTTFQITGFEEEECAPESEMACTDNTCCSSSVEKLPCKETKQIIVANQEDFTGNISQLQLKKSFDSFVIPRHTVILPIIDADHFAYANTFNFQPPVTKHSRAFLQIFLC